MTLLRRAILAFALIAGLSPVFAAAPSPVPALPDTERRTSYSIAGTNCSCNVNFALYGDSTDYWDWLEVWLNGVRVNYNDATFGWTITSPSGTIGSIALPITDAKLTFTNVQTGTVQIVGALRPRRTTQFTENQGVPTRNFNVALTYIISSLREVWDKINDVTGRVIIAPPGETLTPLVPAASRANRVLGFDPSGSPTLYPPTSSGGGITPILNTHILANTSGISAPPVDTAATTWFDSAYCNTIGYFIVRLTSAWTCSQAISANPIWWGADPTGTADSSPAFTSAIASGASIIQAGIGPFKFNSCVVVNVTGVRISGSGPAGTSISNSSATACSFNVTASGVTIENIGFTSSTTRTAGFYVTFTNGANEVALRHFSCAPFFGCVSQTGAASSAVRIEDGFISTASSSSSVGILINPTGGSADVKIHDIFIHGTGGGAGPNPLAGVQITSCGDCTLDHVSTVVATEGALVNPLSGQIVLQLNILNSYFDSSIDAGIQIDPVAGTVDFVKISNPWVATGSNSGIVMQTGSGGTIGEVDISNCTCSNNTGIGINALGPNLTNVRVSGGSASANLGTAALYFAASVTKFSVTGMRVGPAALFGANALGIDLAGSNDNFTILGNDVSGNTGAGLTVTSYSGSNGKIADNIGYNPVGLTAGTSTGTSTSTITAGPNRETHYITQSANFNAVVKSGSTSLCTVPSATVPCVIDLGPNESYSVTWSTTQPTYSKFVH